MIFIRLSNAEAGAVHIARVHPAQQRFDQPVHDLAAESRREVLAERHVLADRGGRQLPVAEQRAVVGGRSHVR